MVLCYSIASGNWSSAATWYNNRIPQAADTVEIRNGHTVTIDAEINLVSTTTIKSGGILVPAFQMSTSYFASITIDNGGKLYASRSVSSILQFAGILTANGVESLDYGTLTDQIPLGVGAVIVIYCTSDNQSSRYIASGVNNACSFYGAERVLRETTLAENAAVGANQIVLTDDLGLQPCANYTEASNGMGDIIFIGHNTVHDNDGGDGDDIDGYLVTAYDPGTKTVTLGNSGAWFVTRGGVSANYNTVDVARLAGTKVYIAASNVQIRGRSSGYRPAVVFSGAKTFEPHNLTVVYSYYLHAQSTYYTFVDCCIVSTYRGISASSCTYRRCYFLQNSSVIYGGSGQIFDDCRFIDNSTVFSNYSGVIFLNENRFESNGYVFSYFHTVNLDMTGLIFLDNGYLIYHSVGGVIYNAIAEGHNYIVGSCSNLYIFDCEFNNNNGVFYWNGDVTARNITGVGNNNTIYYTGRLYLNNVVFTGTEAYNYNYSYAHKFWYAQSENHNQVPGAFKAWTPGGITTKASNIIPADKTFSYEHALESDIKPCFINYKYTMKPYEKLHFKAYLRKTVTMAILPRIQIIDPFVDPLVNDSFSPLSEGLMSDSIDTWELIDTYYFNNSDMPKSVILRVLAQNASGIVYSYPIFESKQNNLVNCDSEGGI